MRIQDLPESVIVNLDEDQAVEYPVKGEFEKSYQLELLCFSKKNYLRTWPLRQRMMDVSGNMAEKLKRIMPDMDFEDQNNKEDSDGDSIPTADDMRTMCMMGGFDAMSAMEEFKQLATSENLIKIDDDVFMNKQRWETLGDDVKEVLLFTYLANFIQPCVAQ